MGTLDWARLVSQNRAKAMGVSWSNDELNAIYKLGIPPDYVRKGIITLEEYSVLKGNEKKRNKISLSVLPLEKILMIARKEKIEIHPDMNKDSLITEIRLNRKFSFRTLIKKSKKELEKMLEERNIPFPKHTGQRGLSTIYASLILKYERNKRKKVGMASL